MFDQDRVQSELDLQRTVSQSFNQNVQAANTEINQHLDQLKAQLEKGEISQSDYDTQVKNWQRGKVLLNSIASGLSAPTQSTMGIIAATASPALSYEIGQQFKKHNAEGTPAHILAHAVLGAAVAAGDNNALAGALSSGGAEAAAPYISKWLYGKDKGSDLTAEEKETVTTITNLLGTATGAVIGDTTANAMQGSLNAQSAVENNSFKALVSSIKVGNRLRAIYKRTRRITWADIKQAMRDEGLDIADNLLTLSDGELTFDDAKALLDLIVGTEFNNANKGEAARKLEQIARKYQPFKHYTGQLAVGDRIDLKHFTQRISKSGAKADYIDPKTKWRISPDRGNNPHGGSTWKLIDSKDKRVGTISEDGLFLRD